MFSKNSQDVPIGSHEAQLRLLPVFAISYFLLWAGQQKSNLETFLFSKFIGNNQSY